LFRHFHPRGRPSPKECPLSLLRKSPLPALSPWISSDSVQRALDQSASVLDATQRDAGLSQSPFPGRIFPSSFPAWLPPCSRWNMKVFIQVCVPLTAVFCSSRIDLAFLCCQSLAPSQGFDGFLIHRFNSQMSVFQSTCIHVSSSSPTARTSTVKLSFPLLELSKNPGYPLGLFALYHCCPPSQTLCPGCVGDTHPFFFKIPQRCL